MLFWISAIGFGFAHAFEPDHMAAVSSFVAQRPRPREAISFGLKWAMGHGLALLLLGTVLYSLKLAIETSQPELFSSGILEKVVGVVLIALGLNALARLALGDAVPRSLVGWKKLMGGQRLRERPLEERLVEQQVVRNRTDAMADETDMPLFGRPGEVNTQANLPPLPYLPPAKRRGANALWSGSVLMGLLHGAAGTGAFIGQAAVALSSNLTGALFYTVLFSVGVLVAMAVYAVVLGGAITWGAHRSVKFLRGARYATGVLTCVIGVCLIAGVEMPGLFDKILPH